MKYCMLTTVKLESLEKEKPMRSGLYKWLDVFNGDIKLFREREDLEAYDVVHINLSGGDVGIIQPVINRLENSSTQVVVCNDYSVELMQHKIPYVPHVLVSQLRGVDWFFGTEPMTSNFIKNLIQRKEVYIIPHPCDVKFLRAYRRKPVEDRINILYHRYDNQIWVPWVVTRDVRQKVCVLGYHGPKYDRQNWSTLTLFDNLKLHKNFQQHLEQLSIGRIAYDTATLYTWGRSTVECAALGIPTFGSHRIDSMRRLFPDTCCSPMNVTKLRSFLGKLLKGKKFAGDVVEKARAGVDYYDMDKAKERFMACMEANQKN